MGLLPWTAIPFVTRRKLLFQNSALLMALSLIQKPRPALPGAKLLSRAGIYPGQHAFHFPTAAPVLFTKQSLLGRVISTRALKPFSLEGVQFSLTAGGSRAGDQIPGILPAAFRVTRGQRRRPSCLKKISHFTGSGSFSRSGSSYPE